MTMVRHGHGERERVSARVSLSAALLGLGLWLDFTVGLLLTRGVGVLGILLCAMDIWRKA